MGLVERVNYYIWRIFGVVKYPKVEWTSAGSHKINIKYLIHPDRGLSYYGTVRKYNITLKNS